MTILLDDLYEGKIIPNNENFLNNPKYKRDYRKRKGYTQAQVTEALHFPSKRLGELENGKKQIYVHELVDLINFYEIDIYELFYPWVGSTILVKKRRIEEEIKTLPDGLK